MNKNWKILLLKKNYIFWIRNFNLPIYLGLHHIGFPSYRRSLQSIKESMRHYKVQNMKFLNFFYFCGSFLPSWIRIRIQNPWQAEPLNLRSQACRLETRRNFFSQRVVDTLNNIPTCHPETGCDCERVKKWLQIPPSNNGGRHLDEWSETG
jgi:hypothetical protein